MSDEMQAKLAALAEEHAEGKAQAWS